MKIYYIFFYILLNVMDLTNSKDDYIPVLLWTSPEMPEGPTLALNKINRVLFTNYLEKKLSNSQPLVVIFMEQILSTDDFNWRCENESSPFPLLGNITERIYFFPYVEYPHEAFNNLANHGYKWKHMESDWKLKENDSTILLTEFRNIENKMRDITLKKHDEIMAEVTKKLKSLRENWICIYTARHTRSREAGQKSHAATSWHADAEPFTIPRKSLYLYKDSALGLALLTRGPIQLTLPAHKNHTMKYLEDCTGASFTRFEDSMDLVLWFTKYTLTFSMSLFKNEWFVEFINIQNESGQILKLWPKMQQNQGKCNARFSEYQSKGKPQVRIELPKYKVIQLGEKGNSCVNLFTVPFLSILMFTSVAFISLVWSMMLCTFKLPDTSKSKTIQISLDALSARKPVTEPDMLLQ